jgi:uncharacterized flavoprotein (TIGR03862 family)
MKQVAVIGAGPAGLIAAEYLSARGFRVTVYDRKKSPARKFLLAGRGGLNITHSEPLGDFLERYSEAKNFLTPHINVFTPEILRIWCHELSEETFIGSSGRVFPRSLKASPLLRSWLKRLEAQSVSFLPEHLWQGWSKDGDILINGSAVKADAVMLALGGASWPELGSDGSWTDYLKAQSVNIVSLRPANCGFSVDWSDHLRGKFSGTPLKSIALRHQGRTVPGEIMIDRDGIEGGAIYALSAQLRDEIAGHGKAILTIDLKPSLERESILQKLSTPRKRASLSSFLQKSLNLPPLATALLYEADRNLPSLDNAALAALIKDLPLTLQSPFPIRRAISTAGGIALDEVNHGLMIKKIPGVFAAGEMLDWEAPTGGYLLQACFATGMAAAKGIEDYLS